MNRLLALLLLCSAFGCEALANDCNRVARLEDTFTLAVTHELYVPDSSGYSPLWAKTTDARYLAVVLETLGDRASIFTIYSTTPGDPSPGCSSLGTLQPGETAIFLLRTHGAPVKINVVTLPGAKLKINFFTSNHPKPSATPVVAAAPNQTLVVTTKSFIRTIVVDSVVDGAPIPPTTGSRLGFGQMVGGRTHALAFALLTDRMFSENPTSGQKGADDYRLWSTLKVSGQCAHDRLKAYRSPSLQTAFGKEWIFNAEGAISRDLEIKEAYAASKLTGLELSYEVSGRPSSTSWPLFNAIKPRTCTWIWHHVKAHVFCAAGKLKARVSTSGSAFPSRKTWLDDELIEDVDQGPFDRLWECDPADPSRVR